MVSVSIATDPPLCGYGTVIFQNVVAVAKSSRLRRLLT